MADPVWLDWVRRLQAIAQNGLTYGTDPYDRERYEQVREVAAEIAVSRTGTDLRSIRELFANESGHATPKVDVRAAVFQGGRILLVKERADGLWTLPGGWADIGESPAEATVRETYEESGYRTRATKLLALYDRSRHGHTPHPNYIYKIFFLCELLGGEATPSSETEEVAWFAEHEIPPLSTGRVTPDEIDRFFEHSRQPDMPSDFD